MAVTQVFQFSTFRHVNDNRPISKSADWDTLVTGLTKFDVRSEKDGRLWSPAIYRVSSTRSNANVESISCLVLDFDGGYDHEDFVTSWTPYAFIVHSSHSSTSEHPKWRAVFPFASPVPASEWIRTYAKLALHLGHGAVDPACKDASRMYYLPSHPPGATPFVLARDGKFLDPSEIPDLPDDEVAEVKSYSGRIRPGDDYEQLATWESILEPIGWRKCRQGYGGMALWTRPGKSSGVSARTGIGTHGDRFYCWSSEARVPLRKLLTKFSLFAHLNHNGDFAAAADALRSRGYGLQAPSVVSQVKEGEPPKRFHLSDLGNAERFIALYGANLRYCHLWGRWLIWTGRNWSIDEHGGATLYQLAHQMVRDMQREAASSIDEEVRKQLGPWAFKCETKQKISAIVDMARMMPGVEVAPGDFDRHRNLLNLGNGTYDLESLVLRKHDPADYITRLIDIPYDSEATCPTWQAFLLRILGDDKETGRFIWRALGYSLSGYTSEQCFFFLHGQQGNNGKSTFVETVMRILGDYGRQTSTETLMVKRGDPGINNDIARLKEARFVAAPETDDGSRLNEGLIKRLTGEDTITARYLHQEFFEFRPQFKLWMTGNHKPQIRGTDNAIWRRVVAIPFNLSIPESEQDPKLKEKLWGERQGILSWMIDGWQSYKEQGLRKTETIKHAIDKYRVEMDLLGSFLDECTVVAEGERIKVSLLYGKYVDWTKSNGEYCMGQKRFGQAMAERGEGSEKTREGWWYSGRKLVEEERFEGVYRGDARDV